ncbi:hypothetical protein ABW636_13590 [Aquimarina sp. 2201CG1-2-11]|uniref:hypothetical protein n=1 Tax=Aquimarina discodermiae TaxID=3231043 RepID=UPI0034634725
MNRGKKFLLVIFKVLVLSVLIVSCSEEDDSGSVNQNVADPSFVTNENPEAFIETDGTGKVTVKVTGSWSDGGVASTGRGYVYGTSPDLKVVSGSLTVEPDGDGNADIKELDQNTTYYIRGYIKKDDNSYFYGNEIKVTTPKWEGERSIKMNLENPRKGNRNIVVSLNIKEIEGNTPLEIGIEYSTSSDFSASKVAKSTANKIVAGIYNVDVIFLTPVTKYYFRPYARYNDQKVDNGGNDKIEATTENLLIGLDYPLTTAEFADVEKSRFVVFAVDKEAKTAKIILKEDIVANEGWKDEYDLGELSLRNPKQEELQLIKTKLDNLPSDIFSVDAEWLIFSGRADTLSNTNYWIDEEDGATNAYSYNPVSQVKTSIAKTNTTLKTRHVLDINY